MPGRSGGPVVTYSCAFVFRTRGCGCIGHPAFPTPSGAELLMTKLARMRRDRKAVSLNLGCLKMDSAHPRLVPSPLCGGGPGRGWPHRHCSCGTFIVKAPPPVWAPLPNPPPQGGRERTAVVEIATLPTEAGRRNYFATCVRKDAAGSPRNPALVFHPTG
jgi:hypothetical protein